MSGFILNIDNTGYVQLSGYQNGTTQEYINDAVVNIQFTDSQGDPVGGLLETIPLSYEVGSNGNYSASISEDAEWEDGDLVKAKIVAISSGIKSTFNCTVLVEERN